MRLELPIVKDWLSTAQVRFVRAPSFLIIDFPKALSSIISLIGEKAPRSKYFIRISSSRLAWWGIYRELAKAT